MFDSGVRSELGVAVRLWMRFVKISEWTAHCLDSWFQPFITFLNSDPRNKKYISRIDFPHHCFSLTCLVTIFIPFTLSLPDRLKTFSLVSGNMGKGVQKLYKLLILFCARFDTGIQAFCVIPRKYIVLSLCRDFILERICTKKIEIVGLVVSFVDRWVQLACNIPHLTSWMMRARNLRFPLGVVTLQAYH